MISLKSRSEPDHPYLAASQRKVKRRNRRAGIPRSVGQSFKTTCFQVPLGFKLGDWHSDTRLKRYCWESKKDEVTKGEELRGHLKQSKSLNRCVLRVVESNSELDSCLWPCFPMLTCSELREWLHQHCARVLRCALMQHQSTTAGDDLSKPRSVGTHRAPRLFPLETPG